MRGLRVAVMAVLLAGALTGCSGSATSPGSTGSSGAVVSVPADATPAQIVSVVCTRCHPTDRIKAASHDAAAWNVTVTRMRGKGAQLTDAQADKVIEFLAGGGASQL